MHHNYPSISIIHHDIINHNPHLKLWTSDLTGECHDARCASVEAWYIVRRTGTVLKLFSHTHKETDDVDGQVWLHFGGLESAYGSLVEVGVWHCREVLQYTHLTSTNISIISVPFWKKNFVLWYLKKPCTDANSQNHIDTSHTTKGRETLHTCLRDWEYSP